MDQIIEVDTADFAIGKAPQILETKALGSCIAVCIYDKAQKVGALCHIMLPHSEDDNLNPHRFADSLLPIVFDRFVGMGVDLTALEAHIIGGASMFTEFEDYLELGKKNVEAAEIILISHNIPIKSKQVGGHHGRSVKFFLETGEIQVITK